MAVPGGPPWRSILRAAFVGGYTRGALVSGQPNLGGEDMFVLNAPL